MKEFPPYAVMTNFSHPAYMAARRFAVEARDDNPGGPTLPQIALPMASVILAFTALESLLAEDIEFIRNAHRTEDWPEALQDARGLSLDARWSMYFRLRGVAPFDSGQEPYQSFVSLTELRNLLVHRAARFHGPERPFPSKRIEALRGKFSFSPDSPGFSPWDAQVLNAACARWACNTASKIRDEHASRIGRNLGPAWAPID